jgi:hypothetical protein
MKAFISTLFVCILAVGAQAQKSAKPRITLLDKSPMDMTYFPNDYPLLRVQNKTADPLVARIIYSRPQKNNREIFGELIPYNEIWRLGANEATEIQFFQDVHIGGKKLPKGRYTMYAVPTEEKWTIIFNKDTDIWGAFKYNEKADLLRVDVPVQKQATISEAFTMDFAPSDKGADLQISWDDVSVVLPVVFK